MNDVDRIADRIAASRDNARTRAASSLDGNPDDAARALELSDSSGVLAPSIYGNLEDFEKDYKTTLNSHLINSNPYLSNYINSHPLAAAVSHDDFAQLDRVSESLSAYGKKSRVDHIAETIANLEQARQDYQKGSLVDTEYFSRQTYAKAIQGLVGLPGLPESTVDQTARATNWVVRKVFGPGAESEFKSIAKSITPVLFPGMEYLPKAEQFVKPFEQYFTGPLPDEDPEKWIQNIFTSALGFAPFGRGGIAGGALGKAAETALKGTDFEELGNLLGMIVGGGVTHHYIKSGKSIPIGVDPTIDKLHVEQAKEDAKNFDTVSKDVQASATQGRSTDMMAKFIAQRPEAFTISVPAEVVKKLYGEEQPVPGDGKLGDVVNPIELAIGADTGGDVSINLADFLAKVPEELQKELGEDIRHRPNGLTLNEAKELPKAEEPKEEPSTELVPAKEEERLPGEDPIQDVADNIRATNGWDYVGGGEVEPKLGAFSLRESKELTLNTGKKVTNLGTTDVKTALREINLNALENKEKGVRKEELQLILDKAIEKAGDTPIHVVADEDYDRKNSGAYYDHVEHQIVIPYSSYTFQGDFWRNKTPFHEALHAATVRGLHSDSVLAGLLKRIYDNILEQRPDYKYDPKNTLDTNYGFKNEREMIAELANPNHLAKLRDVRIDPDLARQLDIPNWRKATGFDAILHFIRHYLGLPQNAVTALEAVLNITERATETPLHPKWGDFVEQARAKRLEAAVEEGEKPPEPTPFEGRAIGVTKAQMAKILKLVQERNEQDKAAQLERGKRLEELKQSKLWREDEKNVREEVKNDIPNRPDIAAALYFRDGVLGEQRFRVKPKINPEFLDDQQRASLPQEFLSSRGLDPDSIAGEFGYDTGAELVADLAKIEQARGDKSIQSYITQMINDEVAKRMEYRHGNLGENIIEAAQDHVLGTTQMDLLHEWTMAYAEAAGVEPKLLDGSAFTKENVDRFLEHHFENSKQDAVTPEKYFRAAARNGALLKTVGDPVEALKAQQQQYFQVVLARKALAFQKEQKKFENLLKKDSKRDTKNIMPYFLNMIHDIMYKVDVAPLRPKQDLEEAIYENRKYGKDLEDFANKHVLNYLTPLPIPDFLYNPKFKEPLDKMIVGKYRAVRDAITSIDKVGRDFKKIEVAGEKTDLDNLIKEMVEKIKESGGEAKEFAPGKLAKVGKAYGLSLLQAEHFLNRIDLGDPRGIMHQAIIYKMAESANERDIIIHQMNKDVREAAADLTKRNMNKAVKNNFWIHPFTEEPIKNFTRRNVLGILQNIGNTENLKKLAEGWNKTPEQVLDWVWQNVTEEDVDRAQKIGGVFNKWFNEASRREVHRTGIPLQRIDTGVLQTPWGVKDGWYNPISYDRDFAKTINPENLVEPGYTPMYPRRDYTKARTGFIDAVELNLDIIPVRLRQMANDIAMRDAVLDVKKIITHPEFEKALKGRYDPMRLRMLHKWLKDAANRENYDSEIKALGADFINGITANTISVLTGWNLYTVGKHSSTALIQSMLQGSGIGFVQHFNGMMYGRRTFDPSMSDVKFAFTHSNEMQRRLRNFSDLVKGGPEISLTPNSWSEIARVFYSMPIALGDMASALPTWMNTYEKAWLESDMTHGQAVAEANRAVRHTHGSSVTTSRPEIMRMRNPLGNAFATLYGFFNHMTQRHYEVAWRTIEANRAMERGDYDEIAKQMGKITVGVVSNLVWPALVEHYFTTHVAKKDTSYTEDFLTAIVDAFAGSFIGVRDLVKGLVFGREPQLGINVESVKEAYYVAEDIIHAVKGKKQMFSPEQGGKTIKHMVNLIGIGTALTNAAQGNAAEFVWRYNHGLEHPDGIGLMHALGIGDTKPGWMTGLKHGTLKRL